MVQLSRNAKIAIGAFFGLVVVIVIIVVFSGSSSQNSVALPEAPVAPSETPVWTTMPSVVPSETPVWTTMPSVAPSQTPVWTTMPSVAPSQTPVWTTMPSVAPSQTTMAPSQTTMAPSQTTMAPSQTTMAPSQTTMAPSQTTMAPSQTTMAPSQTTMAPSQTTMAPSQVNGDIYYADTNIRTNPNWTQVRGKLIDVSINPDGSAFGVNSANNIYYSPSYNSGTWNQLPGLLNRISSNGTVVMGVNSADNIFYADRNIRTNPNWTQVAGGLIDVSLNPDGSAFGVNRANNIYYSPSYNSGSWTQLPGSLKQISSNGTVVMGVNSVDDIFYADRNIRTNPNWTQVRGKLIDLSVNSDGSVFGVNSANNIYYSPSYNSGTWNQLPGGLKQISSNGTVVMGVN